MIAPLGNFQSFFENTSIPDIAGLDITPVFFLAACILIWAAGFRIGAISSQTTNETIIRKPKASSNPSRPAPEEKTRAVSPPPLIKPASSLEKESIPRRERTATVAAGENLRQLVYIDRLTKLHNQRSFDENLGKEISRSTHYRHNFALLMLDLDQLDLINEKFGNSSGDEVLKTISAMAAEQVRGHDQVFRLGGEEFMILMPETPLEGASKVAERLRLQLLMQNFFDPKGNLFKATCSIGITNFVHENPAPAEKLLELADRALKIAKGKGRNQIGVVDSTTLLSE
jgi:diguanylate cyclase (GGDEF)-like protein